MFSSMTNWSVVEQIRLCLIWFSYWTRISLRVATQAQRHIYRNPDPSATPLETDEAERLKNIRRTMKKHFFPTEILLIAIFLMQFLMHFSTMTRSPARTLSSPMMISTLGISLFVAAIHAFLALNGLLWLRRSRRAVDSGEEIPVNRFYRRHCLSVGLE